MLACVRPFDRLRVNGLAQGKGGRQVACVRPFDRPHRHAQDAVRVRGLVRGWGLAGGRLCGGVRRISA